MFRKLTAMAIATAMVGLGGFTLLEVASPQASNAGTPGVLFNSPGPGGGAPPTSMGGLSLTPFLTDPQPEGCNTQGDTSCLVDSVDGPTSTPDSTIDFSGQLTHDNIGNDGFNSFSDGYTGDVYTSGLSEVIGMTGEFTGGTASVTITLPDNTRAFNFDMYAEFGSSTMVVTANSSLGPSGNTTSGPVLTGYATNAGFYTQDGSSITSITVTDSAVDGASPYPVIQLGQFSINVASAVTISAPSPTITYGATVPTPTAIYSTGVATSTPATCSYSPPNPQSVGAYAITCGEAADPGTIISYDGGGSSASGTLTINPASGLTVTGQDASMTYGGTYPSYTAVITGMVNGDSEAKELALTTCTGPSQAQNNVPGTYGIDCTDSDPNYSNDTDVPGTLTVNQAPLTVSANSASMVYGGTLPTLSASFSGLVLGESAGAESGYTTCTAAAPVPAPVGTFAINCTDTDPVYGPITYVAGVLTVTPAPLTITAPSLTLPYGSIIPDLSPLYAVLVNGDTPASLTTPPTCTSKATSTSVPGKYTVTCGNAVDANYVITYKTGKLTIVAAPTSFTISDYLTKGARTTTAVLAENGLPTGAIGTVTFKIGTRVLCTIDRTGKSNESSSCFADLGMGFSGQVVATFTDSDGNYTSSTATNQLTIHF